MVDPRDELIAELRRDLAEMRAELVAARAENAELRREIAALKETLRKSSRNSSKPPSSDGHGAMSFRFAA